MAGNGIAYPADAVTGSPTYAAINGRNAFSASMSGATATKPLGGISGVRPGTPSNTITASSTTWTMNPNGFAGYIELESAVTNSGYFFSFSGTVTGSVTAAAGSARFDLIYVQINDSNTGDGSSGSPRVVLDYQAGTPGAGVPTLSAARAFVVATISVPASGGGSPTVSWIAPWAVAAGGVLPTHGSSEYPSAAYIGQLVDDISLGYPLRFNGTNWGGISEKQIITPASVAGGGASIVGSKTVVTAATSFAINGVFSGVFDHYYVDISAPTLSASNSILARMRLAGTDDTASNYIQTRPQASNTTVSSTGTGGTAVGVWTLTEAAVAHFGGFELYNPGTALATRLVRGGFGSFNSGGVVIDSRVAASHGLATAYDGITFSVASGTFTGVVSVYGYNR